MNTAQPKKPDSQLLGQVRVLRQQILVRDLFSRRKSIRNIGENRSRLDFEEMRWDFHVLALSPPWSRAHFAQRPSDPEF
jgi:hypothetical protein